VTLVYSRTPGNAAAFGRDFGVPAVETDFDRAVRSNDIDAFYVATPPTAHRREALACLAAGKPVLIEKPIAASLADAEAIAEAARASGVFCMEGLWTRFLPLAARARQLIAKGAIGTPRSLAASFGASNRPDAEDNQFRADLGGGALLHRGIYALSFALDLLGPAEVAAAAATIGATGVDEDCSVVLRHERGALSTIRASLSAPLPNDLTVEGTHGLLRVGAPIYRPFRLEVARTAPAGRVAHGNRRIEALRESGLAQSLQQRLHRFRGGVRAATAPYAGNGYHYEADEVRRCIETGRAESELMPLTESLAMARLIERARLTWSAKPVVAARKA
jgi:predicted dehydrogenase